MQVVTAPLCRGRRHYRIWHPAGKWEFNGTKRSGIRGADVVLKHDQFAKQRCTPVILFLGEQLSKSTPRPHHVPTTSPPRPHTNHTNHTNLTNLTVTPPHHHTTTPPRLFLPQQCTASHTDTLAPPPVQSPYLFMISFAAQVSTQRKISRTAMEQRNDADKATDVASVSRQTGHRFKTNRCHASVLYPI